MCVLFSPYDKKGKKRVSPVGVGSFGLGLVVMTFWCRLFFFSSLPSSFSPQTFCVRPALPAGTLCSIVGYCTPIHSCPA